MVTTVINKADVQCLYSFNECAVLVFHMSASGAEHLNSGVAYSDFGKLDIKLVAQNKFHLPSGLVLPSHFYKI